MKRYLNSFNNKRDANEPEIIEELERYGVSIYKLNKPADLLCCLDGVTFLVEVKSAKGKYTPAQVEFQETWRGLYYTVRCRRDVEGIVRNLSHIN